MKILVRLLKFFFPSLRVFNDFYSEKPDFSHATENYPSLLAFLSAQTLWFLFVETGGGTGMLTGKSAATAEGRQSSGTSVHSALTRTQFSSVQSLIRV